MKVPRLTHRSTDSLPGSAKRLLEIGFESGWPAARIARELRAVGYGVNERTIARRSLEFRRARRERELRSELNSCVGTSWRLEDLVGLLEDLEFSRDWRLRSRRRVTAALRRFLKEPDAEAARAFEGEVLKYRVLVAVSERSRATKGKA